jgi:asparagine synthetase B (glutamine-hydrolysing)
MLPDFKVLLLGTGADELFGGYSKFRKCFEKSEDWEAVARLLAQDLARIPYRNLGRDDRVVSDSGILANTHAQTSF